MNFLKFRNAEDFLDKTDLSLKDALDTVESELIRQKARKKRARISEN